MSRLPTFPAQPLSHPLATRASVRGRRQPVPPDEYRNDFQRDVHRILYSRPFRRLRHKTQVFYFPRNDHVSTRMDHVHYVAAAARTVARCLGLNEDLAEAIALAHDIGHAPFGHNGEDALNQIIEDTPPLKSAIPRFEHEVYGLRVVDCLALRDREQPGLNLTYEVRDGIVSHWGEDYQACKIEPGPKDRPLEHIKFRADAGPPTTLEGCLVRMVDRIAYAGKDIEDALATDVITEAQIPNDIMKLGCNNGRIVNAFIGDLITHSLAKNYIALSDKRAVLLRQLLDFNIKSIYESSQAEGYRKQTDQTLKLLFMALRQQLRNTRRFADTSRNEPNLPFVYKTFRKFLCRDMKYLYTESDPDELIVLDFVAGMTDSFAVRSFQELFIPQASV